MYKKIFSLLNLTHSVSKAILDKHLNLKKTSLPFLYIDITDKCNSRCLACPVWQPRQNSCRELSYNEIEALLPSVKKLNTRLISFGGGEPLLRDDIYSCINLFSKNGISTHINTNALILSSKNIKKLIDSGLNSINISCDHVTPEKYKKIRGVDSLDTVFRAIKEITSIKKQIAVALNVVVSKENIFDMETIAAKLAEFKPNKIQFIPINFRLRHRPEASTNIRGMLPDIDEIETLKKRLKRIIRILRKKGIESNSDFFIDHFDTAYKPIRAIPCMAGSLFSMIDPFGNVSPCYEINTGLNIKNMTLLDIVQHPDYKKSLTKVFKCRRPCWDTGSAEPSIRANLFYAISNPFETIKQTLIHIIN